MKWCTKKRCGLILIMALMGSLGADCPVEVVPIAPEAPAPGKLIVLSIINESGLDATVEATFSVGGNEVRRTTRLLASEGAEASEHVVPTQTDLIHVIAREAAPASARDKAGSAKTGDVLAEDEIQIDPNAQSGDTITFIIPRSSITDCNDNGIEDAQDIAEGTSQDCNANEIPDECDIADGTSEDCNANGVPDECDIADGTSADCNANSVPDECDIADGTSEDCNANGVPDECDIASGTSADTDENGVPDECESHLFVNDDASPGGDGLSWATAFDDLQDALSAAAASGGRINEIWVASGVYMPDANDRTVSFELLNDVAVRGGFAGDEAPFMFDLADRDFVTNVTILSGNAGDLLDDADNSCHVVTSSDATTATAVLDGFTITGGNADFNCASGEGGGLYNEGGSPTLTRMAFVANGADFGGGMSNTGGGSPTLTDCLFSGNEALHGAGIYNLGTSPTLTNCAFLLNEANLTGGGIHNCDGSSPALTNCTFGGNNAGSGGGIYNYDNSSPTVVNCAFTGNTASEPYDGWGGGMLNALDSAPTVTNCTFSGNQANSEGGGIYTEESTLTLTNCILWGNSDSGGLTDESAQLDGWFHTQVVNYCCIQGWTGALGGTGNIGGDPLFVRDPDPGPDGNWDNVDDDYGDLHLQAGSPCIDAGDNNADIDANTTDTQPLPTTDLEGNNRFLDDTGTGDTGNGTPPIVDMGAHEFDGTSPPPP